MKKTYLSKSKLMDFLQCPKRLYLEIHRPELAEVSEDTEQAFATGHQVGEMAQQQYPDGILIGHDRELTQALRDTKEALTQHPDKPIFEATFQHDGVLIRADLMLPNDGNHNLVEVKSSSSVKPHYPADCAIQTWVMEGAGYPLERVELAHIDTSFVYPGGGDYRGLLHHANTTAEVRSLLSQVPVWVEDARRTLAGPEPAIAVGKQCYTPHACPFQHYCWPPEPEYPVTLLPNDKNGKVAKALQDEGHYDLRDVPPGRLTNPRHEWIRRVTVKGKPDLRPEAAKALCDLPYPRYYLDFETIQFAVPIWAGTRPYQILPFQWSCHIETAEGELLHEEFLGVGSDAPMRDFAERLILTLAMKGKGPIFVYNRPFEAARIRELITMFPDLATDLNPIPDRIVDLMPIARENYYHPEMKGSWSLKAVLPTIVPELDYANLDHVQDGGMAEIAYMEILGPNTSAEHRQELIQGLREYCKRDTLGLVMIARFFQERRQPD